MKHLLPFLLLANITLAQSITIKGKVSAKKSGEPLPYASIYLKQQGLGVHANENGDFEWFVSPEEDSIIVQALGYQPLQVSIKEALKMHTFFLDEVPIPLATVQINKKVKVHTEQLGATSRSTNMFYGQNSNYWMTQVALYLPNIEAQEGFLHEVGFYIGKHSRYQTPFRVRIYDVKDDKPNQDLLTENVIVSAKHGNRYCYLDLSQYNIPFGKDGVFVAMEWLNLNDEQYYYPVTEARTKLKSQTYGQKLGITNRDEELEAWFKSKNKDWRPFAVGGPMIRAKIDFYDE